MSFQRNNNNMLIPKGTEYVENLNVITSKNLRTGDNSGFMAIKYDSLTLLVELCFCVQYYYICYFINENNEVVFKTESTSIKEVKSDSKEQLKKMSKK